MYKYDLKYKNKEEFISAVFNDDNIYDFKSLGKCSCGNHKYYRISLSNIICTKCFMLTYIELQYLPSDEGWEQIRVKTS